MVYCRENGNLCQDSCLILILLIVYIKEPIPIPMGAGCYLLTEPLGVNHSSWGIPTQGRGGEETHKCLDIIGGVSASHQETHPQHIPWS